jgi:hypothetical protein
MDLRAEILSLLAEMGGRMPDDAEQADIVGRFGMDGADITEFLDAYSQRFNVRLNTLLWYFHYFDEPPYYRRVFAIGADGRDVPLMPITVDMLVKGAESGNWPVVYPDHREEIRWWRGGLHFLQVLAIVTPIVILIVLTASML